MDFESQIEKIVKDIRDREDREMAYELVKRLSPLLIANGVTVKTTKYNLDEQVAVKEASSVDPFKKELIIHYGISIDGLDFPEHEKRFKDEIRQLKHELSDVQKSADEYYNKCIDLTNQIEKLKSELETKVNFETDRLVKLPFDPLETANMLINATYKDEIPILERQVDRDLYDIDDLEQIAEHLLVYCKHNRESEE